MTEEQLQQKIEAGEELVSIDAQAYRKVFSVLKKEPYQLPAHFADRVLLQIRTEPNTLVKEYVWFGLGLAAFFIAAVVSVMLTHFSFSWGALGFFSTYPGLIALALVLLTIIQWLDKKVLHPSDF